MKSPDSASLPAALALASAMFASALAPAVAAPRAANYDGNYSVEVITDVGSCDKSYRWAVQVEDGKVHSAANMLMEASGRIDRTGLVQLAFHRDTQVAHVAGYMKGSTGSGTWSSPTMRCGGRWRAERLG
jgi:hypothetical protein